MDFDKIESKAGIKDIVRKLSYFHRFKAHFYAIILLGIGFSSVFGARKLAIYLKQNIGDARKYHDEMEDFMYFKELEAKRLNKNYKF